MRDKEVQTVTHPIETYIEKDYSWNIWDYKRKAVKLVRINYLFSNIVIKIVLVLINNE